MGKFLGRLIGFTILITVIILVVSYFVGTAWLTTAINYVTNFVKSLM